MDNNNSNRLSSIIPIALIVIIIIVSLFAFNVIPSPFSKNNISNDITFKEKSIRLKKDSSYQLVLTSNDGRVKYRSSNSNIVKVNENTGYITGVSDGTAVITAYLDDKELDRCTIEVYSQTNVINVKSVSVSPTKLSLYVGESERLKVAISPSNATEKKLYWSTSNEKVVTVDNNGNVKAIGTGTAYITVRSASNVSANCMVTVSKKTSSSTTTKYKLSYNANGGSVNPSSKTLNKGDKYGTLPTPVRSGYTFEGWYTEKNGGTKVSSNTIINSNVIIYAHWKKASSPTTKYTLTYNANGGKVTPTSKTLNKGSKYGTLPTPTRSGYTFNGWYTEKNGGTKVSSNTIINSNVTIYAHWKKNNTSITKNKTALFVGDSITYGKDGHYSWANYIGEHYDLKKTVNAGLSGGVFSTFRGELWLVDVVKKYKGTSYDYVIMHGGINDIALVAKRGEPKGSYKDNDFSGNYNTNTFIGGLETYIYTVKKQWPNAKIGYIINYRTPADKAVDPISSEYYSIIKKVCKKWNIKYIDLYSGKNSNGVKYSDLLKVSTNTYISDGIHLNRAGYNVISPYIYSWMKTL